MARFGRYWPDSRTVCHSCAAVVTSTTLKGWSKPSRGVSHPRSVYLRCFPAGERPAAPTGLNRRVLRVAWWMEAPSAYFGRGATRMKAPAQSAPARARRRKYSDRAIPPIAATRPPCASFSGYQRGRSDFSLSFGNGPLGRGSVAPCRLEISPRCRNIVRKRSRRQGQKNV